MSEASQKPDSNAKSKDAIFAQAESILTSGHFHRECEKLDSLVEEIETLEREVYEKKLAAKKLAKAQVDLSRTLLEKCRHAEPNDPRDEATREEEAASIRERLDQVKGANRSHLNPGSFFVRLFLGSVHSCVLSGSKQRKIEFKEEYERLKLNFMILNFFSTIILWIWPTKFGDTLLRVAFLYYYVTLSLREDILRVNGSNIKTWWVLHHYVSILICIVAITWPFTPLFHFFRKWYGFINIYSCLLQYALYQYQMKQLYKLKMMGKARELDTVNTETSQGIWLSLLVPFIALGIIMVYVLSGYVFYLAVMQPEIELQAYIVSGSFFFLSTGNSYALMVVSARKVGFVRWILNKIQGGKKKGGDKDGEAVEETTPKGNESPRGDMELEEFEGGNLEAREVNGGGGFEQRE